MLHTQSCKIRTLDSVDKILENVTHHPYLGVLLDNRLRRKEHMETVVKWANRILD